MRKIKKLLSAGILQVNVLASYLSAAIILVAAVVLVYEVSIRYFLAYPTDWEIEFCVMMLITATFLSAPLTQARRGHVSIELLAELLPARANRWRLFLSDALSLVFCAYVGWRAISLFMEAWDDGRTSDSLWGPPLWPVYCCMALGLVLLTLQLVVQLVEDVAALRPRAAHAEVATDILGETK